MSESVIAKLEYNDKECLTAALQELNIAFTEHKKGVQLRGYFGRGSSQTAEIVVTAQTLGTYADLGFIRGVDGTYSMAYDNMDDRKIKKRLEGMKQAYAKHRALKHVAQWGYVFQQQDVDVDGRLHLQISCE